MNKVLAFLACIFMAGCSSSNSTIPAQAVMMPLAVDNTWTYRVTTDSMGTLLTREFSDTVLGTKYLAGQEWSVVKRQYSNSNSVISFNFRNAADGLYQCWDSTLIFHNAKYPAQLADTFYLITGSPHGHFPVTLQSNSHTITTPAGTFNTYYYTTDNHDSLSVMDRTIFTILGTPTETEYYPGIGLIRSVDTLHHETIELVSYRVQ